MAKSKTPLAVTDNVCVMLHVHCRVINFYPWVKSMTCSVYVHGCYHISAPWRIAIPIKQIEMWTFSCFHSHSHYCFRFPAFPLTLNPCSICFTLQGEPEQAWFFCLHELTVHYSNKHYASQPMTAECMPVVTHIQVWLQIHGRIFV